MSLEKKRIRHMALFTLKHEVNSLESERFLQEGEEILKAIPGVERFEVLRQVSPKTRFHYGFSMEFADQAAYDAYNMHPAHTAFVEQRWKQEVAEFQEIDFMGLEA